MSTAVSDAKVDHRLALEGLRVMERARKEAGHVYSDLVSSDGPHEVVVAAWKAFQAANAAIDAYNELVALTGSRLS